jgi:hypothetical protein
MRTLLPLGALLALTLAGCSDAASTLTGPDVSKPSLSCAGNSGNCGGGTHKNNSNNPPNTAP